MNILIKSLTITLSLIAGLRAMGIENNNLGNCAPEIAGMFLREVVIDNYIEHDFTQFIESVRTLKEVCSDWNQIIDKDFMHKAMVLGCEQDCPEFLNGKLIYRPNGDSNEGKIELKISDLWNPLGGTFKLSQCGDTNLYFSISTGYRKVNKPENNDKVEIWFTPRCLVKKELNSTASHFNKLFPDSWQSTAPVGMFWTWGGWDNLGWYDYLTTKNMDNLSKMNLDDMWTASYGYEKVAVWSVLPRCYPCISIGASFHVSFVN